MTSRMQEDPAFVSAMAMNQIPGQNIYRWEGELPPCILPYYCFASFGVGLVLNHVALSSVSLTVIPTL